MTLLSPSLSRKLNAIGLLVVSGILIAGFAFQFAFDELPCPLCLLQRVAFAAVGYGLCLNVVNGPKPQHYAIMLLSALYGGTVAVRQILLHIVPGTGSYGSPVLGLHYYTWAAICFFLIILGTAIMLLFEGQFRTATEESTDRLRFGGQKLAQVAFFIMLAMAAANSVATFLECGPGVCGESPTSYEFLDRIEPDS